MVNRMFVPLVLIASFVIVGTASNRAVAQGPTLPLVSIVDLVVESVEVVDGELVANALVTLDVVGEIIEREVQIPLDLLGEPGTGPCPILHLALGPIELDLLGLVVELDDCNNGPVVVDITADPTGGLLGQLLCGLLDGIDLGDILGDLSPDQLDALTGLLETVLNEVLGDLLGTDAVAASSHGGQGRRCDILTLEVPEGIHLDLLGLAVDTSPICLDVYAVRGGGLLGNLLCGVANLLDNPGNNLGGQLAHVRRILRLLESL